MRTAIVGAGMAGLAAARTLTEAGYECVVFEKTSQPGGRVASETIDGYTFDTGASLISPSGSALEAVMLTKLDRSGLQLIDRPIYKLTGGRVVAMSPETKTERYAYLAGNGELGRLLAEGLDLRINTSIDKIAKLGKGRYQLVGEEFERVILCQPVPQAVKLIENSGLKRTVIGCRYRKCLSILLGYPVPIDKKYHALIDPDNSGPLTWLSIENLKVPEGRAPSGSTAIVAQMSGSYSEYKFERSDDDIVSDVCLDVKRILGEEFVEPAVTKVIRWKYSHVSNVISFDSVNRDSNKILVANDGLAGARVHLAYDMGIRAAQLLMEGI